ncbi:MAG: glycosyltransferase family 1 protein [Acholeplasmatales bacterium]|nr:glycosyltransferase family 1 protein [Acholeplasmatales bacterium]
MSDDKIIRVAQIIGMSDGGVASIIMSLYRAMDKSKVQFDFFVESESKIINKKEIESMGGKVIFIPSYSHVFKYIKTLKKLFIEGKYDIVHSNMSTLSIFSLKAAKKAGIKVRICHSHSTSNKKEWKKNIMKNMLRPFSKKYATHYFACSELAGRYLFGNMTFDKGLVKIINNAIDLDKFKFNNEIRNEIRNELAISNDTFVVGHIGRFMPQKNHKFLIEIFNEFQKKTPNSKLLLIGDGELLNDCKKQVKDLNIENKVIFYGTSNVAYKFYNAMDCFVLPSLYEGLPIVGVEAQTNGLPVFFSNRVTLETKINENVKFISIEQGIEIWRKELDGCKYNDRIKVVSSEILGSKYNVALEAKKLFEKYTELLDK